MTPFPQHVDEAFPSITTANPKAFEEMHDRISRHRRIFHFLVQDLAEHVAERLRARGLSRRWLAERLGKRDSEISKWLSGTHNLTLDSVAKLTDALEEDLLVSPRFPMGYIGQTVAEAVPVVAVSTVGPGALTTADAGLKGDSLGLISDLGAVLVAGEYSYAMVA